MPSALSQVIRLLSIVANSFSALVESFLSGIRASDITSYFPSHSLGSEVSVLPGTLVDKIIVQEEKTRMAPKPVSEIRHVSERYIRRNAIWFTQFTIR